MSGLKDLKEIKQSGTVFPCYFHSKPAADWEGEGAAWNIASSVKPLPKPEVRSSLSREINRG